jgi:hypothetical protein
MVTNFVVSQFHQVLAVYTYPAVEMGTTSGSPWVMSQADIRLGQKAVSNAPVLLSSALPE